MTFTEPIPYAPGDPAWIEARRSFLGASDVPAVLGLSPWRTPLDVWAEKTGLIVQPASSGSLATRLGHELEDLIARLWSDEHPDEEVTHSLVTLRDPARPWLAASTDREVGSDGLLECKLVGATTTALWDDGVPDHVHAQCVAQLAVTGRQWVDVCSLHAGRRWEHRIDRITRDDDEIRALVTHLERWWFGHVVTGIRPDLDGDPKRIRQALDAMHPGEPGQVVVVGPDIADEVELLKRAKSLLADLRRDVEGAENRLIAAIGDATEAFTDPNQPALYSYRPQTRTSHDLKAITAGKVDGFTADEIATAQRVLDAVARQTRFRTLRIR